MPEELIEILLKTAPDTDVSSITMETRLKADLGLTSLDFIVIMFELQDKYGVLPSELEPFETVGDVIAYLKKHTDIQ